MKVDLTDLSPVKKSMVVEVEPELVERETRAVLRRWQERVRLPGFRRGKAPVELIRRRFAREVRDDVAERVVATSYRAATRERGLRPLGDPIVEELTHEAGQPLRYKTVFEVLPEITPRNYRNVEVRRPAARVEEAEIDAALEQLRQGQARLITEEDREAAPGDVVVVDVFGEPPGGEPFRRERMMIEVGAADNLPAFNEHLTGAGAGAELAFSVDYPAEYGGRELAGRTVAYRLIVHEVKRRELPDIDDEFARDVGDFEDLAALRARLSRDLEQRKRRESERALRQALVERVLVDNPVVLPEVLVEAEIRQRLEEIVRGMILQGVDPEKAEIDWKALRERQADPARRSVHARLVVDAVARAESLEVSDEELDERLAVEAERAGEKPAALRARLKKEARLEALRAQLVREKTLDYLTSVANIQDGE